MDERYPHADAVLIENETIKAVGKYADIKKLINAPDEEVDLNQNYLLPGFIDTHTHFFEWARKIIAVDLIDTKSVADVEAILADYAKTKHPEISWVAGSGWDKNIYKDAYLLNKFLLDKYFPTIPVSLHSRDFHTILANSKAIEIAGVDKNTPDPDGGKIGRLADGQPNGFFYEKAWEFIANVKPELGATLQKNVVEKGIQKCTSLGLTAVHVMESKLKYLLYKEAIKTHDFSFFWHFPISILDEMIASKTQSYTGNEELKICGAKIFMDGAIGSQSAFMSTPYPGSNNFGSIIYDETKLQELVNKASVHKIAVSVHAIGDKCVEIVAKAIAKANKQYGFLPHRIEHVQCATPEILDIIAQNNIYAAVQPVHISQDIPLIKKYWPQHEKNTYLFKSMLLRGIKLGFGSDAPVEDINPFKSIYCALTRKAMCNPANISWLPQERLNLHEALAGFTIDAATGSQSQLVRGSISPGKRADLIVLPHALEESPEYWLDAKCRMTFIKGKIAYDRLT